MNKTATAEARSTKSASGNHPTFKLNLGNISVAVFADEKSTSVGEAFTSHSIALQKSWKASTGEFEDRILYLDRRDVMKVITALQQAYLATYDNVED